MAAPDPLSSHVGAARRRYERPQISSVGALERLALACTGRNPQTGNCGANKHAKPQCSVACNGS